MLRQSLSILQNKIVKNTTENFLHTMYFDGCSKCKPYISGAGAVIYNNYHDEIWSGYIFLGNKYTNNEAEYSGLILGLNKAVEMNINHLLVIGNSKDVIYQMTDKYNWTTYDLSPLFIISKKLEGKIENIKYKHISRNIHHHAHDLSNFAIQKHLNNNFYNVL